jgi:hypothetical protein
MADTPLHSDVLHHETKCIYPNTNPKAVQSVPAIQNKPKKDLSPMSELSIFRTGGV